MSLSRFRFLVIGSRSSELGAETMATENGQSARFSSVSVRDRFRDLELMVGKGCGRSQPALQASGLEGAG